MIEFTIKTLDSNNHHFAVDDEITVEELKAQVREKMGIETHLQRLIFCGRVLQDDKKLKDYEIQGKVVHLVQRAPPDPRQPTLSSSASNNFGENFDRYGRNDRNDRLGAPTYGGMQQQIRRLMALTGSRDYLAEQQQAASLSPTTGRLEFIRRTIVDIKVSLAQLRAHVNDEENSGAPASSEAPVEPMDNESTPPGATQEEPEPLLDENGDEVADPLTRAQNARRRSYRAIRALRARHSRPRDLAQLIEELDALQEQFTPYRTSYIRLLRAANDPETPEYSEDDREHNQIIVEMASDIMHSFSHAYHAVSDLNFQVGQPNPRLTAPDALPILRHPIPMHAHINVVQSGGNRRPAQQGNNDSAANGASERPPGNEASANPSNPGENQEQSRSSSAPPAGRNTTQPTVNINIQPDPITYQVEIETRVPIAFPIENTLFSGINNAANTNNAQPTETNQQNQSQNQGGATQGQANRRQVFFDFENVFRGMSQAGGLGGVEVVMSMEEIMGGAGTAIAGAAAGNTNNLQPTVAVGVHSADGGGNATQPILGRNIYLAPMPWTGPPSAEFLQNIVTSVIRQGLVPGVEGVALHMPGLAQAIQSQLQAQGFNPVPATNTGANANPGANANSGETVNPGQPANPVQATNSDQAANPGETANPEQATNQAQTANPGQVANPSQVANPGEAANPGQVANAGQEVNSGQPANPSQAPNPGQAANLDQPANPSQPANPGQATNASQSQAPNSGQTQAQDQAQGQQGQAAAGTQNQPRQQPNLHQRRAAATSRAQSMSLNSLIYDRFLHCDSVHARRRLHRRRDQQQLQQANQERLRSDRSAVVNLSALRNRNPNMTQRFMDTMLELLQAEPSPESWYNALMIAVARNLFLSESIQMVAGQPTLVPSEFQPLRMQLRSYIQDLMNRSGAADGENGFEGVADYIVQEHTEFLNNMRDLVPMCADVDVIGSIRMLVRARLPVIIACVMSDSPGETFAPRFYGVFTRLFTDMCALITLCCREGVMGMRVIFTAYIDDIMQDFDESVRDMLLSISIDNLNGILPNLRIHANNIRQFMQFRPRPSQSRPATNPTGPWRPSPMELSPSPPVRDEPMRDVPIRDEPMRDEPMRDEPMRDEPMRDEPMLAAPQAIHLEAERDETPYQLELSPLIHSSLAPLTPHIALSTMPIMSTLPNMPMHTPLPMHPTAPVHASTSANESATASALPVTPASNTSRAPTRAPKPTKSDTTTTPRTTTEPPSNLQLVSPKMILQHWGEEWVPVFTRDQQSQRDEPSEPYSDAYLSGMPSRKRRCLRQARPPTTLDGFMNESVREAADRPATMDNSAIRTAFREHMRNMARNRASNSEDYDPLRYASAARFLNTTRSSKQQQPESSSERKDT